MIRYAQARNPDQSKDVSIDTVRAYSFVPSKLDIEVDNLRYEFNENLRTSFQVTFASGCSVTAAWPEGDDAQPFFYLTTDGVRQPTSIREVARTFPHIGVVPKLVPLEMEERLLDDRTVKRGLHSHLASRHFRNQLYLLRGGNLDAYGATLNEFRDFAAEWLPETLIGEPRIAYSENNRLLLSCPE